MVYKLSTTPITPTQTLRYCLNPLALTPDQAENVMYNPNEKKATIFDFGLSLEMDQEQGVRECCGSPIYMAPEVILRKRHNAVLSDIWSIGILFYYLLFADCPWLDVEDLEDLIDAILHDVVKFPRYVSKEVQSLVLSMLDVCVMTFLANKRQRNPLKRPRLDAILDAIRNLISKTKSKVLGVWGPRGTPRCPR